MTGFLGAPVDDKAQPLPEKRERLSDCISTFPDTIDLIQERDEEMGPGEGDRAIEIAKLKRELANSESRVTVLEAEVQRMVALNQENLAKAAKAWRERDEMAKEMSETRKLLQMSVMLTAHFAGNQK